MTKRSLLPTSPLCDAFQRYILLYRSSCPASRFHSLCRKFQSKAESLDKNNSKQSQRIPQTDTAIFNNIQITTTPQSPVYTDSRPSNASAEGNESRSPSHHRSSVIQSPVILRKAARQKLHAKLPRKTDFDPLSRNVWARILASPVRACAATHARLPHELLGDYGLVEHPESEQPWMMPVDLLGDEIWAMRSQLQEKREHETLSDPDEGERVREGERQDSGEAKGPPRTAPRRERLPRLPVVRLAENPKLLDRLAKSPKIANRSIIPFRWKQPGGFLDRKTHEGIVWREDMADYVLLHMRKNVVRSMKTCSLPGKDQRWNSLQLGSGTDLVTCLEAALKSLGDVRGMQFGAMLIIKRLPGDVADVPELVRLPLQGTQIPVLYLPKLLSEQDLQELSSHHTFFTEDAVLFRPSGKKTAYTMQGLWRLHSFMTIDGLS